MGRLLIWMSWRGGKVWDGEMRVWVELVVGKEGFGGANPALKSYTDLAFTCHVQRALVCRLD